MERAPSLRRGCLADLRVCVTAVPSSERALTERLLAEAGAVSQPGAPSRADPPHVVVTRSVRSTKLRAAKRLNPDTPAVTPEWVAASAREGRPAPYGDARWRLGAFAGLCVCFSGMGQRDKQRLTDAVLAGGGRHSGGLHTECTHLVCAQPGSEKHAFAVEHAIPVVTPEWVAASVAAGWAQEERAFAVGGGAEPQEGVTAAATAAMAAAAHAAAAAAWAAGASMDTAAAERSDALASRQQSASEFAADAGEGDPSSRQQQQQQQAEARGAAAAPSAALAQHGRWDPGGVGFAFAPPPPAGLPADLWDDDDGPRFLETCRVWVAGCTADERHEALFVLRGGGGWRYATPPAAGEALTHVVVGSALAAAEAAEVAEYVERAGAGGAGAAAGGAGVAVVGMEWIRRCAARRQCVPADERFTVPTSQLAAWRRRRGGAPPGAPGLPPGDSGGGAAASLGWPSLAPPGAPPPYPSGADAAALAPATTTPADCLRLDGSGAPPAAAAAGSRLVSGPLGGAYFTLCALRGSPDEARARALVQLHGGLLFSAPGAERAAASGAPLFAVCPPALPPAEAAALRRRHADFRAVPEGGRRTLYWLECCAAAARLLPASRGAPCYAPLPYGLPLPDFAGVLVAVSGYDAVTRAAIAHTVAAVGGRVSQAAMTRRCTHLLVPDARGEKFRRCAEWGVAPVTADWLVDSVHAGRRADEAAYRPRPPAAGGGGAGGGGSAGAGALPPGLPPPPSLVGLPGDRERSSAGADDAWATRPGGGGGDGGGGAPALPPCTSLFQAAVAGAAAFPPRRTPASPPKRQAPSARKPSARSPLTLRASRGDGEPAARPAPAAAAAPRHTPAAAPPPPPRHTPAAAPPPRPAATPQAHAPGTGPGTGPRRASLRERIERIHTPLEQLVARERAGRSHLGREAAAGAARAASPPPAAAAAAAAAGAASPHAGAADRGAGRSARPPPSARQAARPAADPAELDAAFNSVAQLLERCGVDAVRHGSQDPLPQPLARRVSGGGKRPAPGAAGGGAAKRARAADAPAERPASRRSGRHSRSVTESEPDAAPVEMSQQVGYENASAPASRVTRAAVAASAGSGGGGAAAAKQRLRQLAQMNSAARGGVLDML